MRKTIIRRAAAILLLSCLVLSLSATALADGEPVITGNLPETYSMPVGGTITLTITAEGEDVQYQWYKNNSLLEGQTGSSFVVNGAQSSDAGVYSCHVQNAYGGADSVACTVTILERPVLTQDITITSVSLNEGDTISLSARAEGGNMLTQWYYKRGEAEIREIPGQTTGDLSVTATAEYNDVDIYCQFVNEAGGTTTSFCHVTVNPPPTPTPPPEAPRITKDPTGESVSEGERALFIARADGTTSYIWRFINPGGSESYDYNNVGSLFPGLTITGGTTDTLTLSNIPYELNGWKVACLFRGDGGETLSGEARIDVRKANSTLSIITQPVGGTMALDENMDFTLSVQASASDGGAFSYQWYSAETNSAAAMRPISGATNASYKPERKEGTAYYRVSVILTANGNASDPYFSNTVPVTFTAKKAHVHSYSTAWEHNDLSHWHQCTCGDHADEALHSYEWTILRYPTATEDGQQKGVCTVCGYETVQPVPAGSMPELTPEPPEKTRTSGGRAWVYVLLGALAAGVVGGAAYLVLRVLRSDAGEDEFDEETDFTDEDDGDDS